MACRTDSRFPEVGFIFLEDEGLLQKLEGDFVIQFLTRAAQTCVALHEDHACGVSKRKHWPLSLCMKSFPCVLQQVIESSSIKVSGDAYLDLFAHHGLFWQGMRNESTKYRFRVSVKELVLVGETWSILPSVQRPHEPDGKINLAVRNQNLWWVVVEMLSKCWHYF